MRTVDDDNAAYPLGKPVRKEEAAQEDEYEKVNPQGTILRNKRTGQLRTSITPQGPQFPPSPWQVYIDSMRKQIDAQEADGFPIHEFGVW